MQRLLTVIDTALLQGVQEQLSMINLWTAEFVTVRPKTLRVLKICN
jgi:hypothetical protein